MQQPGYLRGFPASNWNWTTAVLDGTIPYEDICRWIDESYEGTKTKAKNKRTPLPKKKSIINEERALNDEFRI